MEKQVLTRKEMGQARIPAGLDRQGSQQDFWKGNARC
jgi:hypothetical protein